MSDYCDLKLRVRYSETDQMKMAYYANYFVWFEVGRAEFCRQHGFSYEEMERSSDSLLVVAEARCSYLGALRYDQEFVVRTRLSLFRSRKLTFRYELLDAADGRRYAEGETTHVIMDSAGRLKSFPDRYRKYFDTPP